MPGRAFVVIRLASIKDGDVDPTVPSAVAVNDIVRIGLLVQPLRYQLLPEAATKLQSVWISSENITEPFLKKTLKRDRYGKRHLLG